MNLRFLKSADLSLLFSAAVKRLTENGPDFYGWKNDPTLQEDGSVTQSQGWGADAKDIPVGVEGGFGIFKAKLDGAYAERFLNMLGMISALVSAGKRVAILQKAEKGLPFNADGWVIVCIEGYPMFHVAPHDLPMGEIETLVSLVQEGAEEYQWTEWKGTDKVSEYTMLLEWLTPPAAKVYSTNPRVGGDRSFGFNIVPGIPIREQIENQVSGVDATTNEVVILHPIPGVGSSTVAYLRGRNNDFPTIRLVGPDGVVKGDFDLHQFRHSVARPERAQFLQTEDLIPQDAVIVVNSSGRELPVHQVEELQMLTGASQLVVATLQLGQVDLGRQDLGQWMLNTLTTALKDAGVGRAIASRPVVAITAGLSPVNAVITTALHALCESWCSQPVAENREGVFHFTDLIRLEEMEKLGRIK
jgi:hypothetical protein